MLVPADTNQKVNRPISNNNVQNKNTLFKNKPQKFFLQTNNTYAANNRYLTTVKNRTYCNRSKHKIYK